MRIVLLTLLLATTAGPAIAKSKRVPAVATAMSASPLRSAIAAPGRPVEAVALDAARKPADVLAFAGLKPGARVLDILTGTGYYAEVMARVVGPQGSVTAFAPGGYNKAKTDAAFAAIASRQPIVRLVNDPMQVFGTADAFDFAMINLNYHDFYWESVQYGIPRTDPNTVLGGLFHAMKPGGIVAVVDHVGPAGDTRAIVDKLHRIDPATVKADFARAGFVLDGESNILRNTGDDHTKLVFDPAIRGKTDQMVLRFKKPAK